MVQVVTASPCSSHKALRFPPGTPGAQTAPYDRILEVGVAPGLRHELFQSCQVDRVPWVRPLGKILWCWELGEMRQESREDGVLLGKRLQAWPWTWRLRNEQTSQC